MHEDRGGFRSGSCREWDANEEEAAMREARAERAVRHEPKEATVANGVLEEMKLQRRDVERIERMIDRTKRIENALRQMHDERRALGGGSRARIGALLAAADDEMLELTRNTRQLALDFSPPVGSAR